MFWSVLSTDISSQKQARKTIFRKESPIFIYSLIITLIKDLGGKDYSLKQIYIWKIKYISYISNLDWIWFADFCNLC